MSLTKHFFKSKAVCKVRFRVERDAVFDVDCMHLVGDFNDWSKEATPMKRLKNGAFSAEVPLEAGRKYRFRYLADGVHWMNDDEADEYAWCDFAQADNSVVKV